MVAAECLCDCSPDVGARQNTKDQEVAIRLTVRAGVCDTWTRLPPRLIFDEEGTGKLFRVNIDARMNPKMKSSNASSYSKRLAGM